MADDPFDGVLNLEEEFYQEGYKQGAEDGIKAGRIEGRALGLERGFEKFLESGRLHGRAIIWANRLPNLKAKSAAASGTRHEKDRKPGNVEQPGSATLEPQVRKGLPRAQGNPRLEKNVSILYALVEPESLSTDNNDEAVNDFDDRVKRAQGKAKIIERTIGEDPGRGQPPGGSQPSTTMTAVGSQV